MADQQQSSTILTIGQNIVSAINAIKAALTPTSSGLTVGGTAGQIEFNNAGALGGFTASGDATINTATGAVALANVITAGGPTGNSTTIPVITYDAKGRLTAVSTAAIAASGGSLVSIVVYAGTQTVTIPATATKAWVRMWGATGGSGGAATGGAATGGTGGGGYLEKYLTGLTAGNTLAYTQAATGGSAGVGTGAGGNAAAVTIASGTQTISTLTCNGSNGSGGAASAGTTSAGTAGGTATGGDYNETGIAGTKGFVATDTLSGVNYNLGGIAGSNHFSQGAHGVGPVGASNGNAGNPGGLIIVWFT